MSIVRHTKSGMILAATMVLAGCGIVETACTADFRYGITVTVVDAETGQPITEGLSGQLNDGSYSEVMEVFFENQMVGAGERAGTYDVAVSANGYAIWTQQNVRVGEDECHVDQRALTAALESL